MSILLIQTLFWLALACSLWLAYLIFRDIADITQFWLKYDRDSVMRTWYRRKWYLALSLGGMGISGFIAWQYAPGLAWVFAAAGAVWLLFIVGGYFNPGWMMRTMQGSADYVSVQQAKSFIHRDYEVLVIEHDGHARAHTDYELWRPHVVGTEGGLAGENVVVTYCAMTNLGMAFRPEVSGRPVRLKVMTQLENNLVMWDENSGEPIQQIWGTPECNGKDGAGMPEYPLFKMPFDKFAKAYPEGEVFHRRRVAMKKNPFLSVYDKFWEALFYMAIHRQQQEAEPIFPTLKHRDQSLAPKEHVWGINIDDEAVCYSLPFVKAQGKPINVEIGGRKLVVHWDGTYESLGVWYNDFGQPVADMDFWGRSDLGQHQRVESVKAGLFYAMWFNFFPMTDVNRLGCEVSRMPLLTGQKPFSETAIPMPERSSLSG